MIITNLLNRMIESSDCIVRPGPPTNAKCSVTGRLTETKTLDYVFEGKIQTAQVGTILVDLIEAMREGEGS